MKPAIIHGGYNTGNYGDLLLLDLVNDHLRDTYGIRCLSPWIAPSMAPDLHTEAGRGLRDCFGGCVGIMGGGGYLHDGNNPLSHRRLLKYLVPTLIWRATRVPYVMIGPGAGPHLKRGARRVRMLCAGARAVCIRDEESKEVLVRAGVPAESIEVTADIVLGMTTDQIPAADVKIAQNAIGPRRAGVRRLGLHLQLGKEGVEPLERIVKAIAPVLRGRDDIDPVWVFDHGPNLLEDIKRLTEQHIPNARIIEPLAHWPTAALLAELDGLLTTKLHTAITTWTFGVPPCGYSLNHGKTSRFFRQVGRSDFQAELGSDDQRVVEWIECFANDPDRFGVEDAEARETLPRLAQRNYEVIDEHLGDRIRRAVAAG